MACTTGELYPSFPNFFCHASCEFCETIKESNQEGNYFKFHWRKFNFLSLKHLKKIGIMSAMNGTNETGPGNQTNTGNGRLWLSLL